MDDLTDPNSDLIGYEFLTDLPPHRCRVVSTWSIVPGYVMIDYYENPGMPLEIRPAAVVRRRKQIEAEDAARGRTIAA